MEVSVVEAAARLGVSPRRVRSRIADGDLRARRVGGAWLVDEAQLGRSERLSRPMSERVAWAFLDLLDGGPGAGVSQPEQSRLRRKREELLGSGDQAAALLRSWLRRRAEVIAFSVAVADLEALRADARLAVSGVSDPRSGLSAASIVEGYVRDVDVPALAGEYLLSGKGNLNVIVHVVHDRPIANPLPLPVLLADLADHDSPRESAAVARLMRELP